MALTGMLTLTACNDTKSNGEQASDAQANVATKQNDSITKLAASVEEGKQQAVAMYDRPGSPVRLKDLKLNMSTTPPAVEYILVVTDPIKDDKIKESMKEQLRKQFAKIHMCTDDESRTMRENHIMIRVILQDDKGSETFRHDADPTANCPESKQ